VTFASTVFAAGAAGASWTSVLQNRRDRIAAESPAMTIDMIASDTDQTVQVHLSNQGGVARGVEFAPAVGQLMVFGVPHPAPLFRAGESRLIQTAIPVRRDDTIVGFVSCYDVHARRNYVWWPNGEHQVYDFRREKVSPSI
jgi:hypothetical protein